MAEVELKFELPPEAHDAIRKVPLLASARPKKRRLHAVYYDTPDHVLAKHGMALRMRREGSRWVQCLKAGRSGAGGLHSRDEWEFPRRSASLDTSLLAETPFAALDAKGGIASRLEPVFEVDVERTTWLVALGASRLEVALDAGEVRRGEKRTPISELEIECASGDPLAVFDGARPFIDAAPLRASAITKAQRGYALARARKPRPARWRPVALRPEQKPEDAAREVVGAAIAQMQANESGVLESEDAEYLHQFRVALRRLRSALRVFRGVIDADEARFMRRELQALAAVAGEARDWDVFIGESLPALAPLLDAPSARGMDIRAHAMRQDARERLRDAVRAPRHVRLMLAFARWLASPPTVAAPAMPLGDYAAAALGRVHRKAMKGLGGLAHMGARERHRVRIRLKRLRYACDGFAPLFDARAVAGYHERLSRLQDDLGGAMDIIVAERLVEAMGLGPALTASARRRLHDRVEEHVASAASDAAWLEKAPRFWEGAGAQRES